MVAPPSKLRTHLDPPTSIEHEVGGKTLKFYRMSVEEIFQAKDLAKPIIQAVATLLAPTREDRGVVIKDFKSEQDEGSETSTSPVSVDLARFRAEERQRAIGTLVEAFMHKDSALRLARMVADSLSDLYERPVKKDDAQDVLNGIDVVEFRELLVGVAKANRGLLGPFAGRVEETLKATLSDVMNGKLAPTGTGG